jgi:glycosyltransferase involved in cell wall biosynthesis
VPLRILIVAAPPEQIGGQAAQAAGMVAHLGGGGVTVSFQSIVPRVPDVLRRVRYVRTVAQTAALAMALLVRVPRHDVVHVLSAAHSSFLISATPPILIGRLYQRKVVLNYHSGAAAEHLTRRRRPALPVMRFAHAVVTPAPTISAAFAPHGLRARTLPNAIDARRLRFRRRAPLRPVFLTARALDSRYNVACVLRAFALVQRTVAGARLIVAGDGPERDRLERLACELGVAGVEFRGWVAPERMADLYDEADIYLNGSDVDAAPLSLLEAGAAGLPVVTTAAGGIPDMVTDGATGLVVGRGDHVAMAAAAERLLADGALAAALVAGARGRGREHSWEVARARWHALYRELASAR